jgi:hypothetical protein
MCLLYDGVTLQARDTAQVGLSHQARCPTRRVVLQTLFFLSEGCCKIYIQSWGGQRLVGKWEKGKERCM